MNKIEKLIEKLCPNGVELMELGNFINYEQPTKYIVASTNYEDKFSTPVLTAGQTFILGYTNEEFGILNASKNNPVIIFDDFTTSFHWVDFSFKVKSSAMKILTSVINEKINFRYIYYAMKCIDYKPVDHARQWISIYSKFQIPFPPLAIQEKIVEILDKFTQLETELETELEARKAQYQFYRNQLLAFENKEVEWKSLGEVGTFARGKRFVRTDMIEKGFPCLHYGEMYTHYNVFATESKSFICPELAKKLRVANPGDVVIVAAGETIEDIGKGMAWLGESDIVTHDACFSFKSPLNPKYVSYFLRTRLFHDQIKRHISSGKISSINAKGLATAKIPVPPMEEQNRIVKILDQFDDLVNNISSGLPAEIKARRQQYEYYRAKLLTFKVMENH